MPRLEGDSELRYLPLLEELQRQLGVTYKTAYRIGQQIRDLMPKAKGFDALLSGHIELDEAYVGGRRSGGKRGDRP